MLTAVAGPPRLPTTDSASALLRCGHEKELLHLLEVEVAEEVVLSVHTASCFVTVDERGMFTDIAGLTSRRHNGGN